MSSKGAASVTTFRFDQMATLINDRVDNPAESGVERYVGLEHLDADSLRIRRWGGITEVESTKLRFQPGDIIFGKRRVYQRKLAVAEFEGICSAHAMVLRAKANVALPEFLPFFMQSDHFMERALEISVGSLSPTINWTTLAAQEFVLPPIEEQRRLAETLRATESASETLRALAERSVAASQALLERHLALLGPSAPRVLVGDLLVDGPKNGLSPKPGLGEQGLRTVSIGAVSHGVFDPTDHVKVVDLTPEEASPYLVREGDIFAVRGNGNRQLVARVGRAKESYNDLIYPDLLIRMRFDPTRIVPDYLVAQWNHPSVHTRLLSHAKSSNGIWKVNGQDIRSHELMVPPLHVQEAIGEALRSCTTAARATDRRRATLTRIKVSIVERTVGDRGE
jgi:type I restriction enzyme S subunit